MKKVGHARLFKKANVFAGITGCGLNSCKEGSARCPNWTPGHRNQVVTVTTCPRSQVEESLNRNVPARRRGIRKAGLARDVRTQIPCQLSGERVNRREGKRGCKGVFPERPGSPGRSASAISSARAQASPSGVSVFDGKTASRRAYLERQPGGSLRVANPSRNGLAQSPAQAERVRGAEKPVPGDGAFSAESPGAGFRPGGLAGSGKSPAVWPGGPLAKPEAARRCDGRTVRANAVRSAKRGMAANELPGALAGLPR